MRKRILTVAALGLAIMAATPQAEAGAQDYEFQPVKVEIKNATGSEVAVRLVHKPTGKPVAGALVFRSRLDMSPEKMGEMAAKLAAEPLGEPGLYRFKAETTMAGNWALKLMAKVPGESETVAGTIIVTAKD